MPAKVKVKRPITKRYKRKGGITEAEKSLVAQVVLDQPREMTPRQVNGLAVALRRSKEVVKGLVEEARENFVSAAPRYVDIHRQATEQALSYGSVAGLDIAAKSSQWYLERVSEDGVHIVDKPESGPKGSRIMIGIKVGNIDAQVETIEIPTEPMSDI